MENQISNEFVHELDIGLDTERILQLYFRKRTPGQPFLSLPYIADPYLIYLHEKLPGLAKYVSFFWTTTSKYWPIHWDTPSKTNFDRKCALNIPLQNCTAKTDTIFYADPDPEANEYTHVPQNNIVVITGPLEEKFRFQFTRPCILNVLKPHAVLNKGSTNRLLMSWSIETDYEQTVKTYKGLTRLDYREQDPTQQSAH